MNTAQLASSLYRSVTSVASDSDASTADGKGLRSGNLFRFTFFAAWRINATLTYLERAVTWQAFYHIVAMLVINAI